MKEQIVVQKEQKDLFSSRWVVSFNGHNKEFQWQEDAVAEGCFLLNYRQWSPSPDGELTDLVVIVDGQELPPKSTVPLDEAHDRLFGWS
jgi:hypothetical protein